MTLAFSILAIWFALAVLVALSGAWLMRGGRSLGAQQSEALEPRSASPATPSDMPAGRLS